MWLRGHLLVWHAGGKTCTYVWTKPESVFKYLSSFKVVKGLWTVPLIRGTIAPPPAFVGIDAFSFCWAPTPLHADEHLEYTGIKKAWNRALFCLYFKHSEVGKCSGVSLTEGYFWAALRQQPASPGHVLMWHTWLISESLCRRNVMVGKVWTDVYLC